MGGLAADIAALVKAAPPGRDWLKELFWELLEMKPRVLPLPQHVLPVSPTAEEQLLWAELRDLRVVLIDVGSGVLSPEDQLAISRSIAQQWRHLLVLVGSEGERAWDLVVCTPRAPGRPASFRRIANFRGGITDPVATALAALALDSASPMPLALGQLFLAAQPPKEGASDPLTKLPRRVRREIRGTATERFLLGIQGHATLTKAEERSLGRRVRAGDRDAWSDLVRHNLRTAVWGAAKFWWPGASFDDVLQASFGGVMRAAEKFDPDQETRFTTYAHNWMRAFCEREMQSFSWAVRLPANLATGHYHYRKHRGVMMLSDLREAGFYIEDELAEQERRHALTSMQSFWPGRDRFRGEDCEEKNPFRLCADEHDHIFFWNCVKDSLLEEDKRDREILTRRLGWENAEPETLEQIGSFFGITRERVRQIEKSLLLRLRARLAETWPEVFEAHAAWAEKFAPLTSKKHP